MAILSTTLNSFVLAVRKHSQWSLWQWWECWEMSTLINLILPHFPVSIIVRCISSPMIVTRHCILWGTLGLNLSSTDPRFMHFVSVDWKAAGQWGEGSNLKFKPIWQPGSITIKPCLTHWKLYVLDVFNEENNPALIVTALGCQPGLHFNVCPATPKLLRSLTGPPCIYPPLTDLCSPVTSLL